MTPVWFLAWWQKAAQRGLMVSGPNNIICGGNKGDAFKSSCTASSSHGRLSSCVSGDGCVGARPELEGCWAGTPELAGGSGCGTQP